MRAAIDLVKFLFVGALLFSVTKAWFASVDVYTNYSSGFEGFTLTKGRQEVIYCDSALSTYRHPEPKCENLTAEVKSDDEFVLKGDGRCKQIFKRKNRQQWHSIDSCSPGLEQEWKASL
jgi:hypothetical protein